MAKFDKNIKNEFLNDDELYEDEYYEDAEDGDYDSEDGYQNYDGSDSEEADSADTDEDQEDSETAASADGYEDEADSGADSDTEADDADEADSEEAGEAETISVEAPVDENAAKAKWYVVHTYSGYENKVKSSIEKMVENRGMQDLIRRIVIPTEDVLEETKNGERKVKKAKLFPGYVIVNMVMTSESWYLIRNTNGVTGFVGQGTDPIPLTDAEVRHMGIERVRVKLDVEIGDRVRIIDGAYRDYMLIVDDIDLARQKVKGRLGQVTMEIPFDLIEKMA